MLAEPNVGGWGAGADGDGESALIATTDGDTYNFPVEVVESALPGARRALRAERRRRAAAPGGTAAASASSASTGILDVERGVRLRQHRRLGSAARGRSAAATTGTNNYLEYDDAGRHACAAAASPRVALEPGDRRPRRHRHRRRLRRSARARAGARARRRARRLRHRRAGARRLRRRARSGESREPDAAETATAAGRDERCASRPTSAARSPTSSSSTSETRRGRASPRPRRRRRDLAQGVLDAIAAAGVDSLEQVEHLVHGTTVVINALTERKGARTALVTTARLPRRARDRPRQPPGHVQPRLAASRAPFVPRRLPLRGERARRPPRHRPRPARRWPSSTPIADACRARRRRGDRRLLPALLRPPGARAGRCATVCASCCPASHVTDLVRDHARVARVRAHEHRRAQRLRAAGGRPATSATSRRALAARRAARAAAT